MMEPSSSPVAARSMPAIELLCSVTGPDALEAAIDAGADHVRLDCTGAFHSPDAASKTIAGHIRFAHDRGCKASLAYDAANPSLPEWERWRAMIGGAAVAGIDAVALSDPGMMLFVAAHHPGLPMHALIADAAANPAGIKLLERQSGIKRAVLPRVITLASIEQISGNTHAELEVCGFGRLCSIVGPSSMSGNGARPRSQEKPGAAALDPCGDAQPGANDSHYGTQFLPSLSALNLLPQLIELGVRAIRVEDDHCAAEELARATQAWREAIDNCLADPACYTVKPSWVSALAARLRA